jgi:hypothetical protein
MWRHVTYTLIFLIFNWNSERHLVFYRMQLIDFSNMHAAIHYNTNLHVASKTMYHQEASVARKQKKIVHGETIRQIKASWLDRCNRRVARWRRGLVSTSVYDRLKISHLPLISDFDKMEEA